jgi:hypothetical protein
MSDLSPLEQSFALPSVTPMGAPPPVSTDVQPHEVGFRRLNGPREIAGILHLRNEIQACASALGDPSFAAREKKEMNWAWSAPSCATANTSARYATCR